VIWFLAAALRHLTETLMLVAGVSIDLRITIYELRFFPLYSNLFQVMEIDNCFIDD